MSVPAVCLNASAKDMVTLIYGADTYRSRLKLEEIVNAFKAKDASGLGLERLDAKSAEKGALVAATRTVPFLGGDRLIVASGYLSSKDGEAEVTEELLASVPDGTELVFWDDLSSDAAAKKKVVKAIEKSKLAETLAFDALVGPSLAKWVKDETARLGASIAAPAVERLVTNAGNDLWRLHSEIEKLVAFRGGEEIRTEDVDTLVTGTSEEDIFGIMDALSARDTAKASRMIRRQVDSGLEEPYVLAMLVRQARILTQVRSYVSQSPRTTREEVGNALGLHPFVAQKAMAAAHAFAPSLLLALMTELFEADRAVKTGRLSPGGAIEKILATVA